MHAKISLVVTVESVQRTCPLQSTTVNVQMGGLVIYVIQDPCQTHICICKILKLLSNVIVNRYGQDQIVKHKIIVIINRVLTMKSRTSPINVFAHLNG